MRRVVVVAVSLALLAAIPAGSGMGSAGKPALRFASTAPVTVKGSSFKRLESVKLVLAINGAKRSKQVRASYAGSFHATFAGANLGDRCNSDVWARASGRRGSVAAAKLPQLHCPPRLHAPAP